MSKIPLYFKNHEFFNDFGTSCYINTEIMVDTFPLYRHDFIEVSLILSGEGTEIVNGKKYPIKEGSISVCMPWHFHTIHTKPDKPITRFICEFSMEEFLSFAKVWDDAKNAVFDKELDRVIDLEPKEFEGTCAIFNAMYEEFNGDSPYKQVSLYLKLVEFMILFYRAQKREVDSCKEAHNRKYQHNIVQDALRYLHKHFSDDVSISQIAQEVGTSTSSLRDILRGYTGQDFQALLTDIRIRNACILLALKTPTIKYIASNTGFNSIQTFYRVFKEIKGMTPEEFRNKHWMESEGKAGFLTYNNRVWEILYYMHNNFDHDITPESVAQEFHISISYLHKILKSNLMQSFSEVLREIRISYASGLLTNPNLSISQVAIEVGYNNTKTFSRAFATQKGCTPTEFRMQLE